MRERIIELGSADEIVLGVRGWIGLLGVAQQTIEPVQMLIEPAPRVVRSAVRGDQREPITRSGS